MKRIPLLQINHWVVAEVLGTFFLALAALVLGTATSVGYTGYGSLFAPFGVGITMVLLVYLFASHSGSHFNPVVTFSFLLFGKVKPLQALVYVLSQLAGAFLAYWVSSMLFVDSLVRPMEGVVSAPSLSTAEFIGSFILVFTVTTVTLRNLSAHLSAIFIGISLFAGLAICSVTGPVAFNPAISLMMGGYTIGYLVFPFLGALTGSALAVLLEEGWKE